MSDLFTYDSLRQALGQQPFRFYERVTSTQDLAREWASSDPDLPAGAVVIAEEQTAGRGRQRRAWRTPPGQALALSMILRPHLIPEQLPRVTMLGGVAVAATLSPLLEDALALKWPNDVLIHGRKVCGILSEAIWEGDRLGPVVIGIGLNVRVDFSHTHLAGYATSLETELGHPVSRHTLLANLVGHLLHWSRRVHDPALVEVWRGWLKTLGRRVTVYPQAEGSESYEAVAEAVDDLGALIVRLDSGEKRRILAADVGLVQSPDA